MKYTKEQLLQMAARHDGTLDLYGSDLNFLPDDLVIEGQIILNQSKIKELPKGLKCKGILLFNTDISEMPSDIVIDGICDLRNTKLTKLPKNFSVTGSLAIGNTGISKLPKGFSVGGSLILYKNNIELPNEMFINEDLTIVETTVIGLSDNLFVRRRLTIENCEFTFPKKLRVNRNVGIRNVVIKAFPDDMSVGGGIYLGEDNVNDFDVSKIKIGNGVDMGEAYRKKYNKRFGKIGLPNKNLINKYQSTEKLLIIEFLDYHSLLFEIDRVENFPDKTVYHSTGEVIVEKDGFMGVGVTVEEAEFFCIYQKVISNEELYSKYKDSDILTTEELMVMAMKFMGEFQECEYDDEDEGAYFSVDEDDIKNWFQIMKFEEKKYTIGEFKKLVKEI